MCAGISPRVDGAQVTSLGRESSNGSHSTDWTAQCSYIYILTNLRECGHQARHGVQTGNARQVQPDVDGD